MRLHTLAVDHRALYLLLGIGVSGLGTSAYCMLTAQLPEELGAVRLHIRAKEAVFRSLYARSLADAVRLVDEAMALSSRRYGAVSPQHTALVCYKARLLQRGACDEAGRHLQQQLLPKPHVGEGVKEERARLMAAFDLFLALSGRGGECGRELDSVRPELQAVLARLPAFLRSEALDGKIEAVKRHFNSVYHPYCYKACRLECGVQGCGLSHDSKPKVILVKDYTI